jgi:2,4-dienoyl-CoA reductase (NADPH2)
MGSMHTGLEDSVKNIQRLTDYFVERAQGGVGLIITGGYSPNYLGRLTPFAGSFNSSSLAKAHQSLTRSVQSAGSKICLQLLHAGRYAFHPLSVAPSRIQSPITPFKPWGMPDFLVRSTVQDFANAAVHAQNAGYNGVEIMGSEGYLIHQFIAERTNHRGRNKKNEYGGSFENRIRFPLEIVRETRKKVGTDFIIIFRISILDLVEGGASPDEVIQFAQALESAGVTLLNSGIGWHEARIPTIASMVPRGAFASVTQKLKQHIKIPVIAVNRINTPEIAEQIIASGQADLVSLARPLLADPDFVNKAMRQQPEQINTCIACNQACLDHVFQGKTASCLVNPRATEEKSWDLKVYAAQHRTKKKVAVIGAGPAGLSACLAALQAGHDVTLFEKSADLGGQFKLASLIPGKADYLESIRYFKNQIELHHGKVITHQNIANATQLKDFDHVIVAAGVKPRNPKIPGQDLPHVFYYDQYLREKIKPANSIVIIGAGGIGVDTATAILEYSETDSHEVTASEFFSHWGIDSSFKSGLAPGFKPEKSIRSITILQRSKGHIGKGLGKTTGWIHRLELKRSGVKIISGIQYDRITTDGIWIKKDPQNPAEFIAAKQIILCAGQESETHLIQSLVDAKIPHTVVGGAKFAGELDAKRAIREGAEASLLI